VLVVPRVHRASRSLAILDAQQLQSLSTATVTVASYLFSSSYVARTPHSGLKFVSPRERIPIGAVAIAVETRLGAYMIRSLCIFLVLSCVVGLTGLMTGNLWNRYAEENALPRLGGIYQRIAATGAGLVELTKGYAAPATRSQAPATRSQFKLGASPFEE
jgi:hypothetical protein